MIRGIGLRSAIAINVITMIGIGPLITMPLVLAQLAGPLALAGWILGAVVALCDGLVWAELSSRYPGSGGTYVYLREIFGRNSWGRLFAFLFNWQFLLFAPCLLATGYIGFASYYGYLDARVAASHPAQVAIAIAVGVVTLILLYRRITIVAAIGSAFAVVAIGTLLLVIAAAFTHSNIGHAFVLPPRAGFGIGFLAGLGHALYITLYDYLGYSDAALLGDEVKEPNRTIPRAIVLSILIVAALYIVLQIGVLAHGVPRGDPQFIASAIVAESWGSGAARVVTVLILLTALASVFGNLAGFARIPYAAAKDGEFFSPFALLHPRHQFPYVSLMVIGIAALAACFFPLDTVIAILTAGIVLVQGVLQIVALFVMRARREIAPFRMWLFPLPALVALAGWLYAFVYTGTQAISLGIAWLVVGVVAYLITARAQRRWPFAIALALCASLAPHNANAAQWPGGAIVHRNGYPIFTVAGKPFFVYGAALFYERIPRRQWEASLAEYRKLGINTIDLYVMWNWHEPQNGLFDFTGKTNERRDLRGLMRLIASGGFRVILRPGPVIRNEWRNGGYPDWLLRRPEYNMPLHDILEGRYPATATLQNAHSDDAAAEWMRNRTHMSYSARWLRTVLRTVEPWRSSVIAIAIDDDQGAYLDNQTWPAPHFQEYIRSLASTVRGVVGSHVPLFINTYEMKVTASAPVWAWGNWYQSDAYSIGEHDRSQLEFSTGLIGTQPDVPVMISEFQAGWLQGADEAAPRAADPSNTMLALNTLLQSGARGVVNFPVQDTFNPAGWEAPWANAFYSWDAALSVQLTYQARWAPTYRFGQLIRKYGAALAQTHVKSDAAIVYLTSAYDPAQMTKDRVFAIAQAAMDAQQGCHNARISCSLVDLRYEPLQELRRYRVLIVPATGSEPFAPGIAAKLTAYKAGGGRIVSSASNAQIARPAAFGIPNAALLVDSSGQPLFLSVLNYSSHDAIVQANSLTGSFVVRARDAALVPVPSSRSLIPKTAALKPSASFERPPILLPLRSDGFGTIAFENSSARLIISPCAGARAFLFEDKRTRANVFTTVGGLRDAWTPESPPSSRDYIARYTHPIASGTFNRCYHVAAHSANSATLDYTAPDAPGGSAAFARTLIFDAAKAAFTIRLSARFMRPDERLQQLTSFAASATARPIRSAHGVGIYDEKNKTMAAAAWSASAVQAQRLDIQTNAALLTLTFRSGVAAKIRYEIVSARSAAAAQSALDRLTP